MRPVGGARDPTRPRLPPRAEPKMTPEEYARTIKKLGLSQIRAARFFGLGDRKGQRLAGGQSVVIPAIEHLLRLMIKYKLTPGDLDPDFK